MHTFSRIVGFQAIRTRSQKTCFVSHICSAGIEGFDRNKVDAQRKEIAKHHASYSYLRKGLRNLHQITAFRRKDRKQVASCVRLRLCRLIAEWQQVSQYFKQLHSVGEVRLQIRFMLVELHLNCLLVSNLLYPVGLLTSLSAEVF